MANTEYTQLIDQLDECYTNLLALAGSMSEEQWQTQSLCPEWDSRGVVLHLLAVEDSLLGWQPTGADDRLPFDKIGQFLSESASWDNGELSARCQQTFTNRRNELTELSSDQWEQPCPTPVGPASYSDFMKVRIFDFWVHERDIATPLGRSTDEGTAAAVTSLDQVHQSLGYIVGKRIGLPDGMSILFDITGPVSRRMAVVVDGRAQMVDNVVAPSVTVTADLLTFMQRACGRIDPQTSVDGGRIRWSGDDEWGRKAASNLRFTM